MRTKRSSAVCKSVYTQRRYKTTTTNCMEPENAKHGKSLAGRGTVVPKGKGANLLHNSELGSKHSMNADMSNISPDGDGDLPCQATMNKHMRRLILSKPNSQMDRLFKIMEDINYWVAAYNTLSPKPGSLTRGGGSGTIDGTSLKKLRSLKDSVVYGKFIWGLRLIYKPKPQGGHHFPDIPEFQDRLVQCIMK